MCVDFERNNVDDFEKTFFDDIYTWLKYKNYLKLGIISYNLGTYKNVPSHYK